MLGELLVRHVPVDVESMIMMMMMMMMEFYG
jgi:hypothetical protein